MSAIEDITDSVDGLGHRSNERIKVSLLREAEEGSVSQIAFAGGFLREVSDPRGNLMEFFVIHRFTIIRKE